MDELNDCVGMSADETAAALELAMAAAVALEKLLEALPTDDELVPTVAEASEWADAIANRIIYARKSMGYEL